MNRIFIFSDKPSAIRMDEDQVMPGLNMDASLTCQYKGFPDEITWTKTGAETRIFSNNKYLVYPLTRNEDTGITYSKLQVKNVTEADYGSYTCVGQNKFGKNDNGLTGQLMSELLPFTLKFLTISRFECLFHCF